MTRALAITSQPTQQAPVPKLAVFISAKDGVPFEEGLARVEKAGLVIASSKRLAQALATEEWRAFEEALACHSGTMAAYSEPGRKFMEFIEYVDPDTNHRWVFPVGVFRGEKDCILVVEHPDYTLEIDGRNRVVHPKDDRLVDFVPDFPPEDGWYYVDSKHAIPMGQNMATGHGSYLARIATRVGPVRRGVYGRWGGDDGRDVNLDDRPSVGLGVVVEVNDGNVGQITDQKPGGKIILLPGVSQIQPAEPQPTAYEEARKREINQALADLSRPYTPKYPRY